MWFCYWCGLFTYPHKRGSFDPASRNEVNYCKEMDDIFLFPLCDNSWNCSKHFCIVNTTDVVDCRAYDETCCTGSTREVSRQFFWRWRRAWKCGLLFERRLQMCSLDTQSSKLFSAVRSMLCDGVLHNGLRRRWSNGTKETENSSTLMCWWLALQWRPFSSPDRATPLQPPPPPSRPHGDWL